MASGITPLKAFLDKSNTTSFDRFPISEGRRPDIELLVIILSSRAKVVMSLYYGR